MPSRAGTLRGRLSAQGYCTLRARASRLPALGFRGAWLMSESSRGPLGRLTLTFPNSRTLPGPGVAPGGAERPATRRVPRRAAVGLAPRWRSLALMEARVGPHWDGDGVGLRRAPMCGARAPGSRRPRHRGGPDSLLLSRRGVGRSKARKFCREPVRGSPRVVARVPLQGGSAPDPAGRPPSAMSGRASLTSTVSGGET